MVKKSAHGMAKFKKMKVVRIEMKSFEAVIGLNCYSHNCKLHRMVA
jgi:hypothetical protein